MSYSDKKGYIKLPANLHNDPYVDELNSFSESLHEHDERSLILTISAFAEDTLECLLLNYFREPKQAKELVSGFNAPLGTFSARIKAALTLGLIRKDHYRSLELLRKVRNKFAHNWSGVSLDREDIANLVEQLLHHGRIEYVTKETSTRQRIIYITFKVLAEMRLLAKELDRKDIKAPLVMGDGKPIHFDLEEVDELQD